MGSENLKQKQLENEQSQKDALKALPEELKERVSSFLNASDLLNVYETAKYWHTKKVESQKLKKEKQPYRKEYIDPLDDFRRLLSHAAMAEWEGKETQEGAEETAETKETKKEQKQRKTFGSKTQVF